MLINIEGKGVVNVGEKPDENHILDGEDWIYSEQLHWDNVRAKRDALISATDWAALPDSPAYSQELLDYRQALRDIPKTYNKPDEVVWPINPLKGDSE